MAQRLEKTPEESYLYNFDFTKKLRPDDHIVSVSGPVFTPEGLTVGTAVLDGEGKIAQVQLSGGTSRTLYRGDCVGTTNLGEILTVCAELLVKRC